MGFVGRAKQDREVALLFSGEIFLLCRTLRYWTANLRFESAFFLQDQSSGMMFHLLVAREQF